MYFVTVGIVHKKTYIIEKVPFCPNISKLRYVLCDDEMINDSMSKDFLSEKFNDNSRNSAELPEL